jgi:O-methyltransferase
MAYYGLTIILEKCALMFNPIIRPAKNFLRRYIGSKLGYRPDFSLERELNDQEKEILKSVSSFTFSTLERLVVLIHSVQYLSRYKIPGDIVECGVWKGGSMMAAALALQAAGDTSRNLYLFDTFEAIPEPSEKDIDTFGRTAFELHDKAKKRNKGTSAQTASLEEVRNNMLSTGYPAAKIHFVKGKVEQTLPHSDLSQLALLRLDTDYHESTLHELTHLFPALSVGGVLIIDDYGHWRGAKLAVDEYCNSHPDHPIFLHRVDYTGRISIKSSRLDV